MLGRLLVLLAEDVNVPARLVSHVRCVVAAALLAKLGDLGELLLGELDLLEVLGNARGSDGLGNDRVAALLGPVEDDLGGGDGLAETLGGLFGDGLDVGVGDEKRDVEHVVTEGLVCLLVQAAKAGYNASGTYRVSSDVDVLLSGVLDQVVALENGVTLDLIDGRDDTGGVDDRLEVLDSVVGDTNGAGLLLGELGHGLPGVNNRDAVIDQDVTVGVVAALLQGEVVVTGLEGDGPVDEVQVEVVELELRKAVVQGLLNNGGVVLGVPELGCLQADC